MKERNGIGSKERKMILQRKECFSPSWLVKQFLHPAMLVSSLGMAAAAYLLNLHGGAADRAVFSVLAGFFAHPAARSFLSFLADLHEPEVEPDGSVSQINRWAWYLRSERVPSAVASVVVLAGVILYKCLGNIPFLAT